ncbi:hypothetical protein B7494_g2665 [Chlorociboria aeruginascens]|nr:hypothetical protein B7494_g2665 [Chlorociboria aeruginascens]
MTTTFKLAPEAQTGFSNAALYDQHRPSYPAEAVTKLLSYLNLLNVRDAKIIDLACGTGKFTELLADREEGFEVLGIEPHEGMRETLEKKSLKGVTIKEGNAAEMGIEDGWADGVIAAQAWHWFANEESLKEIHRVLKPGLSFGMIWNIEDYNAPQTWTASAPWEQTFKDIVLRFEDGLPRFRHMKWKQAFESQVDSTPLQALKDTLTHNLPKFSLPIGEEDIQWTVYLSDEQVWDRFNTLSQIAVLEGEVREGVKREAMEALKNESTIRNQKGEVAVHGVTHLAWTSRI